MQLNTFCNLRCDGPVLLNIVLTLSVYAILITDYNNFKL